MPASIARAPKDVCEVLHTRPLCAVITLVATAAMTDNPGKNISGEYRVN